MKGRGGHPNGKRTAYALALAGISAALALLFVWLGVVTRYVTVAFFAAAGLAVSIPLCKRYYASGVFALLVSAGLSFLVGDVSAVAGYAIYFGPMALISAVMWEKKVKWYISYPVKIVWINGAIAALYFGLQAIEVLAPDLAAALPYWAIAIVGTVGLLLIDLLMNFAYRNLRTVAAKVIRDGGEGGVTAEEFGAERDDDPFGRDDDGRLSEDDEPAPAHEENAADAPEDDAAHPCDDLAPQARENGGGNSRSDSRSDAVPDAPSGADAGNDDASAEDSRLRPKS